ncbi:MAG: hypothetical protein H0U64_05370 [Gemmatimonadaceae bacterium]|nr:hypothetical protein [Gemmatimonadaceae bacterium]
MTAGKPLPIRLDEETVKRLDTLATVMSKRTGGADITRASALRAAIATGLVTLEESNGVTKKRGKS